MQAVSHSLDRHLDQIIDHLSLMFMTQGITAGAAKSIGPWRYTGDNRAALVPVQTPEGHDVHLLVAVYGRPDGTPDDLVTVAGFSSADTSELNRIDLIDLRPLVPRQGLSGEPVLGHLVAAVADLADVLDDLDANIRSWEQDQGATCEMTP